MKQRQVEVLAPAGSFESMKAAIAAGADAVYIGGSQFGARAYADNLDEDHMLEAINYAHLHGASLYMTVNTLVKEKELDSLFDYLNPYYMAGLDAVIVQDMGVFTYIREHFPDLDIHASTQMTITGAEGASLLKKMGASRVVTARELSLEEIARIHREVGVEIESFVHGALCYCYSGQCLLSSLIGGRSGNRGRCAQPCRLPYDVRKDGHSCQPRDERYVMSLKDLCVLDILPDILEAGVYSLKIEGRMKTALYVATVARTYRKAIDDYLESPEKYQENMPWYLEQIKSCTYRQFTTGFFYGKPSEETQIYDNNTYEKGYTYLGIVGPKNEKGMYRMEQKNKFSVGEQIEVMKPDGRNVTVTVRGLMDEKGEPMESCPHPQQIFYVDLGMEPDEYDILRRREEEAIALD